MKKSAGNFAGIASIALMLTLPLFANGVTPLQIFYVVKQAFPEQEKVEVLISKEMFAEMEGSINRAAAHNHLKLQVFVVESPIGISDALSGLKPNSVLVLFESALMLNNTTKLYILSKCKEKQIAIVTSSKAYSDSGALIALIQDQTDKPTLVLNLKQNEHLKNRFTQELIEKIGFQDVIL